MIPPADGVHDATYLPVTHIPELVDSPAIPHTIARPLLNTRVSSSFPFLDTRSFPDTRRDF